MMFHTSYGDNVRLSDDLMKAEIIGDGGSSEDSRNIKILSGAIFSLDPLFPGQQIGIRVESVTNKDASVYIGMTSHDPTALMTGGGKVTDAWLLHTRQGQTYEGQNQGGVCARWASIFGSEHTLSDGDVITFSFNIDSSISISLNRVKVGKIFTNLPPIDLWMMLSPSTGKVTLLSSQYGDDLRSTVAMDTSTPTSMATTSVAATSTAAGASHAPTTVSMATPSSSAAGSSVPGYLLIDVQLIEEILLEELGQIGNPQCGPGLSVLVDDDKRRYVKYSVFTQGMARHYAERGAKKLGADIIAHVQNVDLVRRYSADPVFDFVRLSDVMAAMSELDRDKVGGEEVSVMACSMILTELFNKDKRSAAKGGASGGASSKRTSSVSATKGKVSKRPKPSAIVSKAPGDPEPSTSGTGVRKGDVTIPDVRLPLNVLDRGLPDIMADLQPQYRGDTDAARQPCPYFEVCRSYMQYIKVPDVYLNPQFDKCYCAQCLVSSRREQLYYYRGEPPELFAVPVGWARFGLVTGPQASKLNIFQKWHVAYHGTRPDNIESILDHRDLLMPGDVTLEGKKLETPAGHHVWDRKQVFVSPTMRYSGLGVYAKFHKWKNPVTKEKFRTQVALVMRVKPGSYTVFGETVLPENLKELQIDPGFSNTQLAWSTEQRGATHIVGLLFRLEKY